MSKDTIHLTKEGQKELQKELNMRIKVLRKEIAKKIAAAADFGDRSENAAYSSALEERDANEARILELETILNNAVIVKEDKGNKDRVVSIGDNVTLSINGKIQEYKIVGTGSADPSKNELSADSPIGKAILGKRKGEEAEVEAPLGKIKIRIKKIG